MIKDYSNNHIIVVEDVSVQYRVPNEKYGTFKEFAIRLVQRKASIKKFYALKNVSFKLDRGEVLGIIGHNGAGKSTLLKVISRVLKPTTGRVIIKGKVSPLLAIGAGFHPELTGRENIYLNGTMLGFSKEELDEKFKRILEFADIGEFINAPLRTYSSGMKARLGFAVATDSQPDVLIIDEVLGVGDKQFMEKSSIRMRSFFERGTTIILVSHSMQTIKELSNKVLWLDHGTIKRIGEPEDIVKKYQA